MAISEDFEVKIETKILRLIQKPPPPPNLRVLSIDYDFFYLGTTKPLALPDLTHCGRCKPWRGIRGLRPNISLRNCVKDSSMLNELEDVIIRTAAKSTSPRLYIAESHAEILQIIKRYLKKMDTNTCTIINIDSHPDDCGILDEISCGNWVAYAQIVMDLTIYDPNTCRWDIGEIILRSEHFDPHVIFLCKSSPYLHPSGDIPFVRFAKKLQCNVRNSRIVGYRRDEIRSSLSDLEKLES